MKGVTKDVAIKIIHREFAPEVIREKFLPRELEIIQLLRHHQNIVKTILINQSNETFVIFNSKFSPISIFLKTQVQNYLL